jgi:hypothetical protein
VDENWFGVLIFCLFVQQEEAKLDPITDMFRTMHVTAFGLHKPQPHLAVEATVRLNAFPVGATTLPLGKVI